MSPTLGLHTKKEREVAYTMVYDAHDRGFRAARMGNPVGLSSEIGYLKAIAELARMEDAKELAWTCERKLADLIEKFQRIFPELSERHPSREGGDIE